MGLTGNKLVLPWPILALGVVAAAAAVAVALLIGGGDDGVDVTGSPTAAPTPTLPPITGTIGYITPDGNFALMDADGGNQRVLTSDGAAKSFAWAPDGSVAALEVGSGAAVGVRGVTPDGMVAFEINGASQPLWSLSGDKLAVAQNAALAVYDQAGNQLRRFDDAALPPAWSPDGAELVFLKVAQDGEAVPVIGSIETGTEEPLADEIPSAEPVYPIAWHPAGGVIAYRNRMYEPSTGTVTELPGTAVYWSPDGRMLLVAGEFNPTDNATPGLLLDASQGFKNTIGLSIRPSAQHIPPQLFIQRFTDWTPDGRYLFYLDPEPGRERRRLYDTVAITQDKKSNIAGERPDLSPDGLTATFMYQGKVWVYPVDGRALAAVAEGGYPAWQPGR